MTFQEAIQAGWTLAGSSWSRGYVSRKIDPMGQPLKAARGQRAGLWFVELPAPNNSTRYHVRQYLRPPVGLLP